MFNLSTRERNLIKILGAVVIGLFLYFFIIEPFFISAGNTKGNSSGDLKKIKKLYSLYDKYAELKEKKKNYENLLSNKNENIGSLLDKWALDNNIKNNIASLTRNPRTVKNKYEAINFHIRVVGVPIQQLMKYLYDIETSGKLLRITYLRISKGLKNTKYYDAIIKLETYVEK